VIATALQNTNPVPSLRELGKTWLAVFLVFFLSTPIFAQQDQSRPSTREQDSLRQAGLPELAIQNLDRVAASAEQIEEVLRKDPGLMVELKRWVAKEATDNGQVVEDSEITDQAIFDRLARDVPFRSVATRLLQRYGFLMPAVNPESEYGREQDLIFKERARRLVQIEEQQDAASLQEQKKGDGEIQRTDACDPRRNLDCSESSASARRRRSVTPNEAPGIPDAIPPFLPGLPPGGMPRTLRAGGISQDESDQSQSASMLQGAKLTPSSLKRPTQDSLVAATMPGPDATLTSGNGFDDSEWDSVRAAVQPKPGTHAKTDRREGQFEEETISPVSMVHRPNPYADIPSLYDMYVQASSRQQPLERFGLDVFRNGTTDTNAIPMDLPVGPDYVVGPGDGLAIDLWGAVSRRLFRIVDREGRVSLPEAGPLLVSGRSLGEVQQSVQQTLRTQFRDVSADVSLSRLRTIRVYVVGDVAEPGAYDISSLSTPLNALFQAGGITARGSLRALKHYRGKQLLQEVDAYDLLLHGVHSDLMRLNNGDTLLVPPIGPQVTVDGMVRRPAIYELHGEKNLGEVLELAGGILPAAALRQIEVQRLEAHEKRTMMSLDLSSTSDVPGITKQLSEFEVHDGDEIHIFPIAPSNEGTVYLQGHVLRPGRYSYKPGMKLTDLVAAYSDLLPEPAPHYAEIVRLNPPDFHPSVESFDLSAALANPAAAPKIEPRDTVRIFSRYDFEPAPLVWVGGAVRAPGRYQTSGQTHFRDAIYLAGGLTTGASLDSGQLFRPMPDGTMKILSVNLRDALAGNPVENVLLQPRDRILVHRKATEVDPPSVSIKGEVAKPGRYPFADNMRVSDLIRVAGGFKRSAAAETADLTRYSASEPGQPEGKHYPLNLASALTGDVSQDLSLRDGDVLTIPQVPGWNDIGAVITVRGEVKNPGVYGIRQGERLSSVLERAGGFLPTAYPQAAVLERTDVRQLQEKARQELIQRLEQEAVDFKFAGTSTESEQATLQKAAFQQRQHALEGVRNATVSGRLVINLSSNLQSFAKSPYDVEVRAGDILEIPKRPGSVLVVGQVYNSNAITYQPGKNAGWYLSRAGGPTKLGDKGAIFVIHANGLVESAKSSSWTGGGGVLARRIGPGDTIVVPEKAIGGGVVWKNVLAIAQIAQTAALSAAFAGL
jgi:polysaccharide export outer membrane protein